MVVDIPIRVKLQVDAADLKRQLSSIGGGIVGSGTGVSGGAPKGGGGKKARGGIVDLGILVDALNPILEPLMDIVHVLVKILGTLVGIWVVAELLGFIAKGLNAGFSSLSKILNVLTALIGKMVEPFVNLLMPLLVPVLFALGMAAKLINTIMRPLFVLMMKVFSGGFGQSLGKLMAQYMTGEIDMVGFMSGIGSLIVEGITQVVNTPEFANAMAFINNLIKQMIEVFLAFLSLDFANVELWLSKFIPADIASALTILMKAMHYVASGLIGFISQLLGKDMFNEFANQIDDDTGELKDTFAEIQEMNKGFADGVKFASVLQDLWKQLDDFLTALKNDPIAALWTLFTTTLNDLIGGLKTMFFGTPKKTDPYDVFGKGTSFLPDYERPSLLGDVEEEKSLEDIYAEEGLIGVVNQMVVELSGIDFSKFWDDITTFWTNTLKPALESMTTAITDFLKDEWNAEDGLKKSIQKLGDAAAKLASLMSSISKGDLLGAAIKVVDVDDAVITPGGQVIRTDPADYLFATKHPERLGGAGNISVTINVNGATNLNESQFKRAVQNAMEEAMANTSRSGVFQRGY